MAREELVKEYAALVDFLSAPGRQDVLTIKRFRALQIRNLLFFQAELAHLQQELRDIEKTDSRSCPDHVSSRWTPDMAREYTTAGVPTPQSHYSNKVLQIRETLTKYSRSQLSMKLFSYHL